MATIKDIAKAAGVSHGTVSNVLNKRAGVSYKKIRLVEQAALAMGYTIDEKASLLRRGKNRTVAVLLPNLSEKCYADMYTGIINYANRRAYDLRLFLTDDLPYVERKAAKEAASLKVCGLLAVSCLETQLKDYAMLTSRKVPLLFLERASENAAFLSYIFDMKKAARLAIAQLDNLENTCVLTGDLNFSNQLDFCSQIALPQDVFYKSAHVEQSNAINALVNREPVTKQVICASEALADKLLHTWQQSKHADLKIIALASLRPTVNAKYSTINLNYRLMGHEAAEAIISQIEAKNSLFSKVFPVYGTNKPIKTFFPQPSKTIRVLAHSTPTTLALEQFLPRFTSRTGIQVQMHNCSMNEVYRRIHSADIKEWDVLRLDPSMLPYLAPRLLKPLSEIDPGAASNQDRFISHLGEDYMTVAGELYALPLDISVQMLFYHRSLLEDAGQGRAFIEQTQKHLKVPSSYEEFDKLCHFFTHEYRTESPSKYGAAFPPINPTSVASDYLPRLLAAGSLSYDKKGRLDLSTSAALETFRNYIDFASCAYRLQTPSWGQVAASFVKGKAAMSILYVHHAANFVFAQRKNVGVEIGFATVPGGRPLLAGGSLGILKRSVRTEEAYQFIVWSTGEQIAPELMMLGGISPCKKGYEHREVLDTYPWLEALPKQICSGIRKPILSSANIGYNQRNFEQTLGHHLLQAIDGRQTPEAALQSVQQYLSRMDEVDDCNGLVW